MNVIISKVYDKQRFKWFIHLKYGYPLIYTKIIAECVDENHQYSFSNLTEAEVRYLQATNSCRNDHEYICKLKIIPTKMPLKKNQNIPPYLDNERKSYDEPKQESLDLFRVKFTKIIYFDEMLNEKQIQTLLKDKNVKSINIDK